MKKLLLLLLLLVLLVLTVDPLREVASPVVDPAGAALAKASAPLVDLLMRPLLTWQARDEARALAKMLQDQDAIGNVLPRPPEFQAWIRRRWIVDREGRDPWDQPYYLDYTPTEVVVGSPGPDREPNTDDDVRVGFPRKLR